MYAGIGRTNSSNVNSNPVESGAEIPEWKRLLIMRKRAGALAATTSSDETNAKTAVSAELVSSHFRNPVASGRHSNLSGNCNVITGCGECDLPPGLHTHGMFSPMLRSAGSTSLAGGESEPTTQDTVVRTIGNITVELRTVHSSRSVLENGDDITEVVTSPSTDSRLPLMSPSSSEPAYLVEEEVVNEEAREEESEDLQYGPGIVDKLRARFLNLGRKNRRRPVVRKFSSLENLSPGGYGTIRAIGLHNKLPKGEYRRSGIRANLNHQHCVGSNFKKAQSMETLWMGSTTSSPGSTPDLNFAPSRRSRFFVKSPSGYASKYSPEITSPRSYQDTKKRFEYSRQASNSSINEAELPKPDTVKQVKKIFESPSTGNNSKENRPCPTSVNHHSNEKQNQNRTTTVLGTPTCCSTPKALPSFNAIAMSGNIRPRKVPPSSNNITNATSAIILEEDVLIPTHDASAKPSDEVCSSATLSNGLTSNENEAFELKEEDDHPPRSPELTNETPLIFKEEENDSESLSTGCRTSKPPCLDEVESFGAKSSDVIVSDNSLLQEDSPTDNASYYDSRKVSGASAEHLPPIEQSNNYSAEKEKQASQGSQVTTEPEHDYHVTSVTRKTPHLHQPDSSLSVNNIDDSPTGEEDSQYDEVCEDDPEDMVVASTSQSNSAPHHHLRTRENHAAVGSQPNTNNLLIFNKKPSNWQKPPQPTTSVVFDFRGKDVKPNISLNPTPFGCKPAKVKKRTGSPPRGDAKVVNGITNSDQIDHGFEDEDDEEDWDEMDIGADLPTFSGITFDGENVKIGRGALLETRNKKLTIQFDDDATATYEYPCESPIEDYATDDTTSSAIKSSSAIGSYAANSSLSNYTPHVLDNSEDFQLGISRTPTHRPPPPLPTRSESPILTSVSEVVIPADPEDTSGWSATETTDILF